MVEGGVAAESTRSAWARTALIWVASYTILLGLAYVGIVLADPVLEESGNGCTELSGEGFDEVSPQLQILAALTGLWCFGGFALAARGSAWALRSPNRRRVWGTALWGLSFAWGAAAFLAVLSHSWLWAYVLVAAAGALSGVAFFGCLITQLFLPGPPQGAVRAGHAFIYWLAVPLIAVVGLCFLVGVPLEPVLQTDVC